MKDTKRILIVEDEPKVAFFLQESLESVDRNYNVVCAASGEDALDEMSHTPFDLIVSDLRMPGMNGLELLNHVREQSPTTQTILITAYGSDEVEAETRRLQAYRYFTKPFQIEEFTSAVKQALTDGVSRRMPGVWGLTSEQLDKITQRLSDLRYEVGAQCILLSDYLSRVLGEVGFTENINSDHVVALMTGGFDRSTKLAQSLREDRSFNLNYHEGTRYDIYAANVSERFFVTLIFDRRQGASRVGMVWLYTKRAVQDLLSLIGNEELPLDGNDKWTGDY